MLRFFTGNQLIVGLFVPILVAGFLALNYFFNYFEFNPKIELGFWGGKTLDSPINFAWISGLIVVFNAFLLNYFFNTNGFHERSSFIVSFLYVILLSYYHSFYYFDGLLFSHTFIFLALFQLFKLDSNVDGRSKCFNAGFFFGIAATFHPPLVFISPFLLFMITRIRPFVFRELFISLIGMLVPLIYAFSFNYLYKNVINFNFFETTLIYSQKEVIFLGSLVLFVFLVISSFNGISNKAAKSSIRFRKNTSILYTLLVFGIALGTVDWLFFKQYEWFCYLVIPISIFLPFSYFNARFKFISTGLFYLTLIFSVIKFFL